MDFVYRGCPIENEIVIGHGLGVVVWFSNGCVLGRCPIMPDFCLSEPGFKGLKDFLDPLAVFLKADRPDGRRSETDNGRTEG